jgi:ubiquilin
MSGGEGDAGGEPRTPGSEPATLHIRRTNGSKFAVRTDLGVTVAAFKAIVAESGDVPALQQRLIYKGRILKDDQTLASYGTCLTRFRGSRAVFPYTQWWI